MEEGASFKVINGARFTGNVLGQDSKYFFDSGRKGEPDYKKLLEDSRDFFHAYAEGTLDTDLGYYYIYGNASTKELLDGLASRTGNKGIIDHFSDDTFRADFYINNPVDVVKTDDGFMFDGEDGRHRFFVAKKYNLDLLVRVKKQK